MLQVKQRHILLVQNCDINFANNPSVSPCNRFFTWNKIPANKNMFKISNKNFRKSMIMIHKVFWKRFCEVVLIFVFKAFQIFLQRYFNYFNDYFQNSYFAGQWAGLQPATLSKKHPFIWTLEGFYKHYRNIYFNE